ncbi:hypothetical protein B7486_03075 [cyanobacterium TDX16]|nr:hypothetical protein B7486_03075 [cyanobacterium TDX16]
MFARTSLYLVIVSIITIGLTRGAHALEGPSLSTDDLPPVVLEYFAQQASSHEGRHKRLVDGINQANGKGAFLDSIELLGKLRDEGNFTPVDIDLFSLPQINPGQIGSLGRVKVLDVISRDAALVIAHRSPNAQLILLRGMTGTVLYNDGWIDLNRVEAQGTEKYDLVLSELRVEREGDSVVERSHTSTGETTTQRSEETKQEEVTRENEHEHAREGASKLDKKTTEKVDRNNNSTDREKKVANEVERILGPERTVLVAKPLGAGSFDAMADAYWNNYRANERKVVRKVEQGIYDKVFKLETKLKDKTCRVIVKNATPFLVDDVVVRVTGKSGKKRGQVVEVAAIPPNRHRTKHVEWNSRTAPIAKVISAKILPAPPCKKCNGSGIVPCILCGTSGQLKCTKCGGDGEIEKRGYRNNGEFRDPVTEVFRCAKCDGRGKNPCHVCKKNGSIKCKKCQGK